MIPNHGVGLLGRFSNNCPIFNEASIWLHARRSISTGARRTRICLFIPTRPTRSLYRPYSTGSPRPIRSPTRRGILYSRTAYETFFGRETGFLGESIHPTAVIERATTSNVSRRMIINDSSSADLAVNQQPTPDLHQNTMMHYAYS